MPYDDRYCMHIIFGFRISFSVETREMKFSKFRQRMSLYEDALFSSVRRRDRGKVAFICKANGFSNVSFDNDKFKTIFEIE